MKLGFSLAFKYKTPKPKPTSFFIGFPFLVFWVPVILHGGKKKIQSWARVLVSTLILAKKPEVHFLFFKMNFSESFFFHDYKFISGFFYFLIFVVGLIFFFLSCVWIVDLLYKDYQSDHKFTITTYSPTGVVSSIFYCFCFIFICCLRTVTCCIHCFVFV